MLHMLPLLVTMTLQASTTALPAADAKTFADRLDYYIRDGGVWVSKNDDYKPGGEQPQAFGYRWEWSLGRRMARLRIDGLFDGDKRATYWENIVAWHPTEERAVMRQVGAGGAFADGGLRWIDDKTTEIRLTFHMPDGEVWAFREIDTIVGPDEFRTASYRLRDGQWVLQRASTWTRVRKS